MHSTLSPIDKVYLSIIQMSFFGKSLTIIQSVFFNLYWLWCPFGPPSWPSHLELDPLPINMNSHHWHLWNIVQAYGAMRLGNTVYEIYFQSIYLNFFLLLLLLPQLNGYGDRFSQKSTFTFSIIACVFYHTMLQVFCGNWPNFIIIMPPTTYFWQELYKLYKSHLLNKMWPLFSLISSRPGLSYSLLSTVKLPKVHHHTVSKNWCFGD